MALHARKENFHISLEEEKRRRENVEYVVNSMKLEGVLLDKETLDNFERYARGELSEQYFIKHGLEIARLIDKKR